MKRIFTAIVLTLSLFAAFGCKQKGANDFIGVQMYSVRDYLNPLDEGVAKIAKAGFSFVEMANYNQEQGLFYGLAPADFKALCEKNGLQVLSSHTNGLNPDRYSMEECVEWWRKAIEDHVAAGCKTIVAPSMAADSLQTLARYCELFNKVGEMCNEAGLKFGYHNHDNEFRFKYTQEDGREITWYDYMLANTDPDKVPAGSTTLINNLVVMPQAISAQTITLTYNIEGDPVDHEVELFLKDFDKVDNGNQNQTKVGNWEAGKHYTFYITIDAHAIVFDASIESWDNVIVNGYHYILN